MSDQVDKRNYDIVSITRPNRPKRENFIQDALHIEKSRISTSGQFIKIFADMFLTRQVGGRLK